MTATIPRCVIHFEHADQALRPCGDRSALVWWLRELCRFGVEQVRIVGAPGFKCDLIAAAPRPMDVEATDSVPAAWHQDRFLHCEGNSLPDVNLARLLADSVADGGRVSERRLRLRQGATLIDSGIRVIDRTAQRAVPYSVVTRETVCDGALLADAEVPRHLRCRAIFLDRDGVLNVDHGYVGSRERFEWIDGALDAVRYASDSGWHVFIVTNQSGVARGFYDEAAVEALLRWIADVARTGGGTIDDARYCPFHSEAVVDRYRLAHPWRKPEPGMLLDLIRAWDVDPAASLMVGDHRSDMQAAAAAGVRGYLFSGGNLFSFLRPILDQAARR